jgi:flagellar biosynthesis protein FlgN
MGDTSTATGQLNSQLKDERCAMRAFVTLLEQEQQILLGTDIDALLELVDKKNAVIADIVRLSQARRLSFSASDTESKSEDALRLIAPDALPVWREIRQLAARSQHLNQTNGQLIQTRLRQNQQTLTVLHNAADSVSLYGSDGQPNLPSAGRTLGKG